MEAFVRVEGDHRASCEEEVLLVLVDRLASSQVQVRILAEGLPALVDLPAALADLDASVLA